MSGNPIIQDGKLIGAATHVFANQPDTGYGSFIETMLEAPEIIEGVVFFFAGGKMYVIVGSERIDGGKYEI